MNDRDKQNLNFILNSMDEAFEAWMMEASADDINYAMELVRQARVALYEQEQQLFENLEHSDLTQAREVLAKVMAK